MCGGSFSFLHCFQRILNSVSISLLIWLILTLKKHSKLWLIGQEKVVCILSKIIDKKLRNVYPGIQVYRFICWIDQLICLLCNQKDYDLVKSSSEEVWLCHVLRNLSWDLRGKSLSCDSWQSSGGGGVGFMKVMGNVGLHFCLEVVHWKKTWRMPKTFMSSLGLWKTYDQLPRDE